MHACMYQVGSFLRPVYDHVTEGQHSLHDPISRALTPLRHTLNEVPKHVPFFFFFLQRKDPPALKALNALVS